MEIKKSHIVLIWCVNICRTILAVVFLFSGFVKAVDPMGTQYKIEDYLQAFGMLSIQHSIIPLLLSIGIAMLEFIIGAFFLLGIRRVTASLLSLVLMIFYTPLTLYIAIKNPVSDCGCFGDALILTNWETFFKNVILLICAVLVWRYKGLIYRFVSEKFDWLVSLYSCLFALAFCSYCLYYLPVLDFRPYKIGTNIPEAMLVPPGKHLSELQTVFLMKKGNIEKEFTVDNYPDSTWTYVDRRTVVVKKGYEPPISDFSMIDIDTGDDISQQVLSDSNYTFLLVSPRIEEADDSHIDLINALYEYCHANGYRFYALTSSPDDEIEDWRDKTGAEYPFCQVDNIILKTIIRSNPGLLLLKHGTILNKWSNNGLFDENNLTGKLDKIAVGQPSHHTNGKAIVNILLWFFVPLLFVIFLDVLLGNKLENQLEHEWNKYFNPLIKKKMRKKIVAGNWKMNKTLQEGIALAKEVNEVLANDKPNCDVIICTPFIHLASVVPVVDAAKIGVGAENCADKESGAYTGEVSAAMVASTGAKYVILGHSERRAYYGETVETLKPKVKLALANGLTPIFCVGEVLEEREANKQEEVVAAQLESVFELSAEDFSKVIIAYEPVWAIGTGKTATTDQAEEIHKFIRSVIAKKYNETVAENTSILYGGSCKPSNAKELFAQPDVDGGLIGGAALKAADFKGIIDAWKD
ncbi:MAG: triose-phosphate isomerase [Bacteroidales bacterium]|nr:triose-phosphate isomerase [Bacteroidales bacterium]